MGARESSADEEHGSRDRVTHVSGCDEHRIPSGADQPLSTVDVLLIRGLVGAMVVTEVLDRDSFGRVREINHRDPPVVVDDPEVQLRFGETGVDESES